MNMDGITPDLSDVIENRYQYNGKELEKDFGINLSDYGARWYDASIAKFTSGDPLASDYSFQSPYAYAVNNPVLFRDIMGMGVDDIIFQSTGDDGSTYEIGRIITDKIEDVVDIDSDVAKFLGMSENMFSEKLNLEDVPGKYKGDFQAISVKTSVEGAFKFGMQTELSFMYMMDGPDKGNWGVMLGGNGLVGIDGGVSAGIQLFKPISGENLRMGNLRGLEMGFQADVISLAGSGFEGFELGWRSPLTSGPFGSNPRLQSPIYRKPVYRGFGMGFSFGPLPVNGTGYFGGSEYIFNSIDGWFPSYEKK